MSNTEKDTLFHRVNRALDSVRPHLAVDGGNVELVEVSDDFEVKVRWVGNCQHCFMSTMTMKAGIEQAIRQFVPEIKGVEAINGIIIA